MKGDTFWTFFQLMIVLRLEENFASNRPEILYLYGSSIRHLKSARAG
jgi:hypothetical protein